jgi:ubiquinone biosynthesis protein
MVAVLRIFKIIIIMIRNGCDELLLPKFLCISSLFISKKTKLPERLKKAFEQLGPIYVKFGQILSTRHDMLPKDFVEELSKLQDKVCPFSPKEAIKIIENELGSNLKKFFKNFTHKPLASASVAQVHAATLHDGCDVVVKILRPKITKTIKSDIKVMRAFISLISPFLKGANRMRMPDIINEFEHNILNELDLVREAGNASQIRRNYQNSKFLYVPEIYWDYSTKNILVMERISGISIGDIESLKEAKVNLEKLAKTGVEIFFSQVFKDRFFHADMHPGNIFVDATDPENPRYIAVDFGIVGALSEMDQRYIAENFLAFFNRDYGKVAQLHVDSGWVPADIRVDQFEMDIRAACEPVFAKPLKDICFGKLLLNLFNTAKKYKMTVQPQLILLQKTLFAVEALGSRLYPQLNLWDTAKPYLETWVKERVGLKGAYLKTKDQLPFWLEKFPEAPGIILSVLENISKKQRLEGVSGKEKNIKFSSCLLSLFLGIILTMQYFYFFIL